MTEIPETTLPATERRLHRALLEGLLATSRVPPVAELAATVGIPLADVPEQLRALAAADYLSLDPAGRVACLYPLSPAPTSHVLIIGEERWYAMCAIDALGTAAMLGRAVAIESGCAICSRTIQIDVEPGRIVGAAPAEAVVVARRSGDEPAWEVCCPFTRFACGPAHGEALTARVAETTLVSLAEALRHGETIFGDLLAETLPARRRRSSLTASGLWT